MADQAMAGSNPITHRPGLERVVPGETGGRLLMEHVGRYEFASRFVRGMRVLDVACGAGYGAPILWGAGARSYVGVDISPEAVSIARSRYRVSEDVSFALGDACRLDGIGAGAFDVVVSFETIEHLEDPERFLARVRDVLTPGGKLVVSTPNRAAYDPLAASGAKPTNPFHVREWSAREFAQLLGRFFEVEETLGQTPYPRWKAVGSRVAAKHPLLQGAAKRYRSARSLMRRALPARSAADAPTPIRHSLGLWRCPTYVLCVCSPMHDGPRNAPPTARDNQSPRAVTP